MKITGGRNSKETESRTSGDGLYLTIAPPHWAAKAFARLLIGLFLIALAASMVIKVPETVRCKFVLTPHSGVDPVRIPYDGRITKVLVRDGDKVEVGAPLFFLASDEIADRAYEQKRLEASIDEVSSRLKNNAEQIVSLDSSFEAHLQMEEHRMDDLRSSVSFSEQELGFKRDELRRNEAVFGAGVLTEVQIRKMRLEGEEAKRNTQKAKEDLQIASLGIEKLRRDHEKEKSELMAEKRRLEGELEGDRIKIDSLKDILAQSEDGHIVVRSPVSGTVLQLQVNSLGSYVKEGDVAAELAQGDVSLYASLKVPAEGIGRIRNSQPVKLMFDAFPYQRYGIRVGSISWISPASLNVSTTGDFVAHAALTDKAIFVHGAAVSLMPGMTGTALVVTDTVRLITYAFEPLRELRENFRTL